MSSAPAPPVAGGDESGERARSAFEDLVAGLEADLGDELRADAGASAAEGGPHSDNNDSNDDSGVDPSAVEAEVARVLGIPVLEAELVPERPEPADEDAGPSSPLGNGADEPRDGGGGREDGAIRNGTPPAATFSPLEVEGNAPPGEGADDDGVIRAESIPTVTICGRTLRRSTALFVGSLVAAVAVVVAIVVPLAARSSADLRRWEAREQRRRNLVGILSPLSGGGAFDPGGPDASADRIDALEWLVGDFPDDASTVAEMTERYPEWKMRQRYILALLYFSTGGPGWYARLRFLSDADECLWEGQIPRLRGNKNVVYSEEGRVIDPSKDLNVFNDGGLTCDADGRVDTITLGVNNLVGTIPPEISGLSESLTKVGLMRNSISSSIPTSLGELKHLQVLNLRENCLTGRIPDGLSDLSDLALVRFQGNNDLGGDLNGFCNGTGYREQRIRIEKVQADCRGCAGSVARVECDCCDCCNFDTMICCDRDGNPKRKKAYAFETFNRDNCSLNDAQQRWREENCPCFVIKNIGGVTNRTLCSESCPPNLFS